MTGMAGRRARDVLSCTFCGKSQKQVLKLIAGPNVFICDECILLCVEIISEEMAADAGDEVAVAARGLRDQLEDLRRLLLEGRVSP